MNLSKFVIAAFAILVVATSLPPALQANEFDPEEEWNSRKMQEKFEELGKELSEAFIDSLQNFLDYEINQFKKPSPSTQEDLKNEISELENALRSKPTDPDTHFVLGEAYDRMGDGASAIIHMREAEKLYRFQNNIKGMAEARRNLRNYYENYDFRPEDFRTTTPTRG